MAATLQRPAAAPPTAPAPGGSPWRALLGVSLGLGVANVVGAGLNALKLLLLLALLEPGELDVLTAGLLVTLVFGQVAGEALSNHATVTRRGDRPDRSDIAGIALVAMLAVAALAPTQLMTVVAPGLPLDGQVEAVRWFCVAGAAMVALWWAAGEAQARLDLRGLAAVSTVPNAAIIVALLVPVGDPVERIALALSAALAVTAAAVGLLARARDDHPRTAPCRTTAFIGEPAAGLGALLILGLASQLNLVALRVCGSSLPPGSLSAVYLSAGAALVPACAVSGAIAGALLPRWSRSTHATTLIKAGKAAAAAAAACAILVVPVITLLAVDGDHILDAAGIHPQMVGPLLAALPILLVAAPAASAAWVLRAAMVAHGRARVAAGLAVVGAAFIPAALAVSPSVEGLALGYGLSVLPWLIGGPILLARARTERDGV